MVMDVARLRCLVDVDYDTGEIFWKPRFDADFDANGYGGSSGARKRFNAIYAGKRALAHKSNGYCKGRVDGIELKAHRVVWAHFHGMWPIGEIDHINRVRDDNRIVNLRDVSRLENARNKENPSRSGRPYIYTVEKPWFGQRSIDGVIYQIDPQKTEEDAVKAWSDLEREQIPVKYWVYSNPD